MSAKNPHPGYARSLLALVLLSAGIVGIGTACTPSPEETCNKLDELGKKDPAGFKLSMGKCMARMSEMKQRDPEAYKCAARTVAKLSSIDTALLAVSVCDPGGVGAKKKKSAED